MRNRIMAATLGLVVAAGMTAAPAGAQVLGVPIAVDARVDAAFPLGDFGDIAGTGVGLSIGAAATLLPGFGVYGNYTQTRFGGGWFTDDVSDATDSGFAAGLTASLPGTQGLAPWVGAGLLFHRLEVRGTRDGVSQDLGFEVGAGIAVPLTQQLRLSPAVSYRQYGATIPAVGGLLARDLNVQYLTLGVGLNYSF